MIDFHSLDNIGFDTLFETFSMAFAEYEVQPNKEELQKMLYRRGFLPELSFGAFDNGRLVSFTCNGIGAFGGVKTAYDTGTGTIKEYRGQGLASSVFSKSIPYLKSAGVCQYLLEVLQHNTGAVSVYRKQGFVTTREFNYFVSPMESLTPNNRKLPVGFALNEISLADLQTVSAWFDFEPSWQNSFDAIRRKPDDFIVIGVCRGDVLVGYGILEPTTGDITQIAVDPNCRRMGVGSNILNEILNRNSYSSIKLINSDVECTSIVEFLNKFGLSVTGKQFEMIKKLV